MQVLVGHSEVPLSPQIINIEGLEHSKVRKGLSKCQCSTDGDVAIISVSR